MSGTKQMRVSTAVGRYTTTWSGTNISGETFETNQLNWDEANQRIYSDSPIRITRSTMIINGIGFESNQMMTRYRINKITGVLPIDTDDSDESNNDQ